MAFAVESHPDNMFVSSCYTQRDPPDLRGQQIFLLESLLHDPHLLRRILAREFEGLIRRAVQPGLEFLLLRQQHGHSLVIDGGDERIRCGRKERVRVDLDVWRVLLHWTIVPAPNSGEREQRPRLCPLEGKPVPRRRLHIAIGFAERSRWDEAPPLLKRPLPKPA